MFVSKHRGKEFKRPVYRILESYREGGEVHKRFIVSLGRYPTLEKAYVAELAKYIRVSNKMERLEYAAPHPTPNVLYDGKEGLKWLYIALIGGIKKILGT